MTGLFNAALDMLTPRAASGVGVTEMIRSSRKLEADLHTVSEENATLKDEQSKAAEQYARLVSKYDNLRERANKEIAGLKDGHDLERASYVSKHEKMRGTLDEFAPKYQGMKQSLKALQADHAQLQQHCHELQKARQESDAEVDKARMQLTLYKSSVSSATKITNQITDGEVCSKMDQVFYAIQGFALKTSRGAEFDIYDIPPDIHEWMMAHIMLDTIPVPKSLAPYIIATLVAKTLMASFEPEHYFGFSPDPRISAVAEVAAGTKYTDTTDVKAWLEATRKLLQSMDSEKLQKADDILIERATSEVIRVLTPALPNGCLAGAEKTLRKISATAFELFRVLHHSKAQFRFFLPLVDPDTGTDRFNPEQMQAEATEEDDGALDGRPIQVSVFPAVCKFGDEMGNNQSEMTVIYKARVTLQNDLSLIGSSK
ncbi:hypothetical protein LTR17_006441 [Elasticomyces elasticus]|nr:hypothetical protein LTR17_006441 [Elasticomyces elasticus]